MNPQLLMLVNAVRKGVESNVKAALRTMEVTRRKDLQKLVVKLDKVRREELRHLKKRLDEVRRGLHRFEAFRPYLSALDGMMRTVGSRGTPRRAARRTVARKRPMRTKRPRGK